MSEPNQKEHAFHRVQSLYSRCKLSPQEIAEQANMSVNTVKKVIFGGQGNEATAHLNSILKVERALELYLTTPKASSADEHTLTLTGNASKDMFIIAKKLANMMHEMVLEPSNAEIDYASLRRLLKSCEGSLDALTQ